MKQDIKYFNRCKLCIFISVITLLVTCISVCFTGVVAQIAQKDGNNIPLYLVGGTFWTGLGLTYICTGMATLYRKRSLRVRKDGLESGKRVGLFCLFGNREAKIMDIVMFLSLIVLIAGLIFRINHSIYVLGSIFMTMFSVHMHAILNGRNYQYIKENT